MSITPSDEQNRAIKSIISWYENEPEKQEFFLDGQAGTGKAQPLSCNIITPYGFKPMGDIKIGDEICGPEGTVRVTDIPYQGRTGAYRITFRDGFSTLCSKDHLWTVQDLHGRMRTLTTDYMMNLGVKDSSGNCRWKIPLTAPVVFAEKYELQLDPYVLGVLIGDGYLGGNLVAFCNPEYDLLHLVVERIPSGFFIRTDTAPSCPRHVIKSETPGHNWIKRYLRDLGLCVKSVDKFIPQQYLFSSPLDRLNLLQGLMDTDGTSRGNRIGFSTSSKKLARDVCLLVQSLGGTAILKNYKENEYEINIKMFTCPFLLPRKARGWSFSQKNPPSRYITDIEYTGETEQRCLTVSSEDGLYLTDHFICTHNSTTAQIALQELRDRNDATNIAQAAYTAKAALVMWQKGAPNASTIHRMIYKADHDDDGKLSWRLWVNGPAAKADLIVIDEVSMVNNKVADDLRGFGKKILVLGDVKGQLPPIGGLGAFTNREPDFRLLELNRFAMEDPINRIAQKARQGHRIFPAFSEGNVKIVYMTPETAKEHLYREDTQIICGRHKVRWATTRNRRAKLGYHDPLPRVGEPILCCQNNYKIGIFNGEIEEATYVEDDGNSLLMSWWEQPSDEDPIPVSKHLFDEHYADKKLAEPAYDPKVTWWDWAYAITCHKAQGSEWPHVTVIDDSGSFKWDADMPRRWLYTALTRASEGLTLLSRK